MNSTLVLSICLSASLLALTLSVISLVYHWIKAANNPDISELWTRFQALQTAHLDLLDKVEHWRRRDNVRNARAKNEEKANESEASESTNTGAGYKAELRRRANTQGLGLPRAS